MIVAVPSGYGSPLRYSLANAACVFENIGVNKALKTQRLLSKDCAAASF